MTPPRRAAPPHLPHALPASGKCPAAHHACMYVYTCLHAHTQNRHKHTHMLAYVSTYTLTHTHTHTHTHIRTHRHGYTPRVVICIGGPAAPTVLNLVPVPPVCQRVLRSRGLLCMHGRMHECVHVRIGVHACMQICMYADGWRTDWVCVH